MARILTTTHTVLALLVAVALHTPAQPAERIHWRAGAVESAPKSTSQIVDVLTAIAAKVNVDHLVVQFDAPVGPAERDVLDAAGLKLPDWLGSNAFFASVSPAGIDADALSQSSSLIDAKPIAQSWKLHPMLAAGAIPKWAVVSLPQSNSGERNVMVGAYVVFHRDVAMNTEGVGIVLQHGARVRSRLESVNGLVVELPFPNIRALADEDAVKWIEPPLPRMSEVNNSNRAVTGAQIVQTAPYELDGAGVTVLVYDGGTALASHLDFGGRLTARDSSWLEDHPTHVSCTIGGDGSASNGLYRGMAPGVTLESYGFEYDGSGIFLYSNPGDIEDDYDEAINTFGADISNNSIGTNTCWNEFPCEITGDYGVTSALIDAIVRGSLGDPFRVVWANGNERSCIWCPGEHDNGYHSTAPPACAKNHISVGALNSNDDSQTSFTSWGPTDDGRLKPDIAAPGCQSNDDYGVTSCTARSNAAYGAACGTSMAAPTVTGLAALLLQDFRNQFPTRPDFRNSTLKLLLAHTAEDLGPPGPDYKAGFGSVRIQQAVDFMRADNGLNFIEASVQQQGSYAVSLRVSPEDAQLKVTLAWDDVPATANITPALVNDLDLRVRDPDDVEHFPWTLDPGNPVAPAVRIQPDHINNIEQVLVDAPTPGLWLVEVLGFNVPEGPQPFSLAGSPRLVYDCDENGVPDDEQILADPTLDCSANGVLDQCEPDCDADGTADSCEIFSGSSGDCNWNGVPDDCEPDDDCNTNEVQDICDIAAGTGTDCNLNQALDQCDLADGTSLDCNDNGTPDECEPDYDCNVNDVQDICDIAAGTSPDCQPNGTPDECDLFDCGSPIGRCPGTGDCCDPSGNDTPGCDCSACCAAVCELDDWCCDYEWDSICAYLARVVVDCNCGGPAQTWSPDCNLNDAPDECDIADGTSVDCNNNGSPDECDPNFDCNNNGVQDICDVANGTSEDCNSNEVPDECEPPDDCNDNGVQDICDLAAETSTDCNENEVPDECDIAGGVSADCNTNAIPDECESPIDCNDNGIQDICDLAVGTSEDCNDNGRLDECDLFDCGPPVGPCPGSGDCCDPDGNGTPGCECAACCNAVCFYDSWCCQIEWDSLCASYAWYVLDCDCGAPWQDWSRDCNGNMIPDECDIADGTVEDCNANGVADECDPDLDCNDNGVQDICDVAGGTSEDCNSNEVPDECDIDCNSNGLPDECDIADGTAEDCNNNGVPDECDPYLDCNNNGVQDICDVAGGTSSDCNRDEIPDECQVDCNANGIPDDCDVAPPDPLPVDDCVDTNAACPGVAYAGNTAGATIDGSATCGWSVLSPDVWYVYTPEATGELTISLCGSSYDTVLSVHTGCPGNEGNEVVCNDDFCGLQSLVTVDVTAGIVYWIRIAGYAGSTGSFTMTLAGPDGDCQSPLLDCNQNQTPDECDVADGTSQDCNTNQIPDECEVDCNANDVPDDCDITGNVSEDCNANAVPDECESDVDCNGNGIRDFCDLFVGTSDDCNENAVPDECDLAAGTSADCNDNAIPDECDIDTGPSEDCNWNAIPDECDLADASSSDCNENDVPDECDISARTSRDCNQNTVPDECDVAGGTSEDCNGNNRPDECELDCNGNGVQDDCDLADGTSSDCNENHVPDECEVDCNDNGLHDDCDLADGTSNDCNGNGRPDECDVVAFGSASPKLSPIGRGARQWYTIVQPPQALGPVTLRFAARADLSSDVNEYLDVYLNVVSIGTVFHTGASDCPFVPDTDEIVITADTFNAAVGDGDAVVDIGTSVYVDASRCPPASFVTVTVEYQMTTDCDENGIPDECDPDCNGNGVPDDCDVTLGTSEDCDENRVPDECELDTDDDAVIDACDPCPHDNPDDYDGDGVCNSDDECPLDAAKIVAGYCGCGNLEDDADEDGVPDCIDQCPGVDNNIYAPGCVGAIPTVSGWGLTVLTLLLLTAAKVHHRRQA